MISKRLVFFHLVLLAFITGVTFFNAVHSSFKMDDHDFFNDPKIRNPSYLSYNWIPEPNRYLHVSKAAEESGYRPVTNTVLALLYHRFGEHTQAYHWISMVLFYAGCALLYCFVLLVSSHAALAFLTAALFIVHPVNGLAVNYVVASAYSYQLIFMMLTMILFVRSYEAKNKILVLGLGLLCFLFSLGVHETSLILPVCLLLAAWFMNRESLFLQAVRVGPFLIVLAAYFLFRMKYASLKTGVLEKYSDFHMSVIEYAASFVKLVSWYLSQLILPDGMVLLWATKPVVDQPWVWIMLGIFLIGGSAWFVKKFGRSVPSLALLWFLIGFLPVLAACLFRPMTGLIIEPHWMFFSSVGFFILSAWWLMRFVALSEIKSKQWVGLVLCGALLIGLIRLSHSYNDIWSDDQSYSSYWLEKVPSFKTTEFFLAYALMRDKNYPQAREHLLKAREEIFSDWQIYSNLGVMDLDEQRYDDAIVNFQKALSFNPGAAEVYNNLGLAYEYTGRISEAVEANQKVLDLNRFLIEPRLNLARIALSQGDLKTAAKLYSENLTIAPYERRTFVLFLTALMDAGQWEQTEAMIQDLALNNTNAVLLTDVASLAAGKNKPLWALDLYMQALRIDPGYKEVYIQAGVLLANLNQLDRAIQMWQQALAMDPADATISELIKKARDTNGVSGQ